MTDQDDRPNGFPREGEHNTVTAQQIDRLLHHRSKLNHVRNYVLPGAEKARIQATAEAERTYAYNRGSRILEEIGKTVRSESDRARNPARHELERIKQQSREHLRQEFESQSHNQMLSP